MKISTVIGANYGDEGKGLITDYLSSQSSSMVVRFNGGAQAGHTVVTPEGKRHVFHHFGSGTLAKAETFLSQYFVACPIFFVEELKVLSAMGFAPNTYIDHRCPITTPFDIMINQAAEESRGDKKHGSCGMGFNETVHRNQDPDFTLSFKDLFSKDLMDKLKHIREKYVPARLDQLKISDSKLPYLNHPQLLENFLGDCEKMVFLTNICKWEDLELDHENVVFEGAQGLMLDEDHTFFPHVTRSKTGLKNVAKLLAARSIATPIDVYYVTRTYVTRHGAGPFPEEMEKLPYDKASDTTNVTNAHQGDLRFGIIDFDYLTARVMDDLFRGGGLIARPHYAITCADQVGDRGVIYNCNVGNGFNVSSSLQSTSVENFMKLLLDSLDAESGLISYGPTRKDVREFHL
jgi:adenylosuccinate synthase